MKAHDVKCSTSPRRSSPLRMAGQANKDRPSCDGGRRQQGLVTMTNRTAAREFLFTYRFDGAEWGTSVFAADPAEAKEKIKAMALARYDGELMMRIPVGA